MTPAPEMGDGRPAPHVVARPAVRAAATPTDRTPTPIEHIEIRAPEWCPACGSIVPAQGPDHRALRRLRDIAWIAAIELEQDAERLTAENLPESARVRAEMAAALHAAVRAAGGSAK